jgi:hypothetical protein
MWRMSADRFRLRILYAGARLRAHEARCIQHQEPEQEYEEKSGAPPLCIARWAFNLPTWSGKNGPSVCGRELAYETLSGA